MKDRDYLGTEGVCSWPGKPVAADYHEKGTFTEKQITKLQSKMGSKGRVEVY